MKRRERRECGCIRVIIIILAIPVETVGRPRRELREPSLQPRVVSGIRVAILAGALLLLGCPRQTSKQTERRLRW